MLAIASLLLAGQLVVQSALDRQVGDARVINLAGRQRMLSQRLCMLQLARDAEPERAADIGNELRRVADEWESSQDALRARDNSDAIRTLFAQITEDHHAMLAAARTVAAGSARLSLSHQDAFLAGMNRIVAEYEREARERVVTLRYIEILLFALALVVIAFEGAFVFRPTVRALAVYLAQRDRAERQLVDVSDREQQRIADDLHDGLCQQLVGISYLVKSLPASEHIDEIGRLLAGAVDQTRDLARGLHSPALDADGLVAALRELAVQTERLYGVTCRVQAETHDEVPADARSQLYRIAREAVVNAAKHARAKSIDIELDSRDGELALVVRDDGVGISRHDADGLGLHMMESRAKMLGALLEVAAGSRGGTIVTCSVPKPA